MIFLDVLDRATPGYYKMTIKVMVHYKRLRILVCTSRLLRLEDCFILGIRLMFCEDKELRISVYDFIHYFCGVPISWDLRWAEVWLYLLLR